MVKDFTLIKYKQLLISALENNYILTSYEDFIAKSYSKILILRHDVDKNPENSLQTANLERELGVKGTYYFRSVKESFNEEIIKNIADFGHEIGYHYEDLSIANGDFQRAIDHFEKWLDNLCRIYPVKTICMHGSPLSRWDNRKLWDKYDYKDYGIIAEPYFNINFNEVLYVSDTGRRWDGDRVSVRDKVHSSFNISFHSTDDMIKRYAKGEMPNKIMQNVHPQRWTNIQLLWWKELIAQNTKNVIKKAIFVGK